MSHCAIGLWMHTYFNSTSVKVISTALAGSAAVGEVSSTYGVAGVLQRITQENGLPLLCLLALGLFVFVVVK